MSATIARQHVDVVVTPDAQGVMSIMIDPCLDSLRVGRFRAIDEMLMPGVHTSMDSTADQLQPEAAIIKQLYRNTNRNEHARELIQFLRDGGYVLPNGVIKAEGLEAAKEIKVTYRVKNALGFWETKHSNLAERGIGTAKSAILKRKECYVVHNNVSFLPSEELAAAIGVDADDLIGDTFYVPTALASGALASCSASETKQSTKLRVLLPNGYEFLVAWLRLNGRAEALQSDKW